MPEFNTNIFLSSECCRKAGFYGNLQNICYTYILNGADHTGKSEIITRLADKLSAVGLSSMLIKNPGDPDLSDGVIFDGIKTAVVVGDQRTGVIPKRSPAFDLGIDTTHDLCRCDNTTSAALNRLYVQEADTKNRSVRFSKVAAELLADNIDLCHSLANTEKVSRFAERLSIRNLPVIGDKETDGEFPLFFSAFTPNGCIYYNNCEKLGTKRVVLLDDPYVTVSAMLLSQVKAYALIKGYTVICSYDPLFGDAVPDFIIIKEAGFAVGVIKKGGNNNFNIPVRKVNCRRFYDNQEIAKHRERLNFNRQASNEMLSETVKSLRAAKNARDRISEILRKSISRRNLQNAYDRILGEIASQLDLRLT